MDMWNLCYELKDRECKINLYMILIPFSNGENHKLLHKILGK